MRRRRLLATAAMACLAPGTWAAAEPFRRVRPGDAGWPDEAAWAGLRQRVGGRLQRPGHPLDACGEPSSQACTALFRELKNPYFIGDDPALSQTCGWVGAWTAQPSAYVVAARDANDVAEAVGFAREHRLRLVVRGGGHSYLGTSTAPDSLMIWTRGMDAIALHDEFVPQGCAAPPVAAVTLGAGVIWMHAYQAVMARGGRFVQGGGCGTVGVAGLVLGGGFGPFSKAFGTAAANLLEAEVVTADGTIRTVNACRDPALFWALKGGGGGSFGVVTRVTLRTHPLPPWFGVVGMTIRAASAGAYRKLLARFVAFYAESLHAPHWGNTVTLRRGYVLEIGFAQQGLEGAQAEAVWRPFMDWLAAAPDEFRLTGKPLFVALPGRGAWDPATLSGMPGVVMHDDRPGAAAENVFWAANLAEAGHVLYGFESLWLPDSLLSVDGQAALVEALFAAGQHWTVELHFQKGLAGGSEAARAATEDTATNPAVLDAFALAIVASEGPPGFPGVPGHEPNADYARRDATQIAKAVAALRAVAPGGGAYLAECDYHQSGWQQAFWGPHYARLLDVKRRYDPEGLFFVHHGVDTEGWSEDGFERLSGR